MLASLLAGVLLALSLLPLPASAAVTTSGSSPTYYVSLTPTKITTSTGKVVFTEVYTSTSSGYGLYVSVEKGLSLYGIGEVHEWALPRSGSIFAFSPATGKGSVSMTSSEEGPFGRTNLAFTASSKTTKCGEGGYQYKLWKGTLKGTFVFKTGFWGAIGSSNFAKPATISSSETTTRCKLPLPPCTSGVSWSVFTSKIFGFGVATGSTGAIGGERNVKLLSPAGASRTDGLFSTAPKPTLSGGVMKVSTPGGKITGSATIKTEGTPFSSHYSCKSGSVTKTETSKSWNQVAYSSPAGHAITFHLSAPTGDVFSLPQQFTGGEGSISVSTVS